MNSDALSYFHVKVTINGNELYTCGFAEDEVLIGRGTDCQVLLENAGVSRNHAKLIRDQGKIKVLDLHSGNGTFVNGKQVQEAVVDSRDTLRIGKFTLYVKLSDQPLESPQPQNAPAGGTVTDGTVFLRPDERVKILQQSKTLAPRERAVPTKKAEFAWPVAAVSCGAGLLVGLLLGWALWA